MPNVLVEVSEREIDPHEALDFVSTASHGASVLFVGAVRDTNLGKAVVTVSYDGHVRLAETALRELAAEAVERWPDASVFVQHRLGTLKLGVASVVVAAGAPHRDEAYEVSRYVIEELKTRIPVWKKETYVDGESEWLRGHSLCHHGQKEQRNEPGAGDRSRGRTIEPDGKGQEIAAVGESHPARPLGREA